ncbi:ATP-binding protein [Gordonia amarae]|uniref:ATP-binding protein n=2 Tax=Gordonia amarae TaxID=36821 RepID=A0A857L3D7_9ACTN|nr:ATP-binding protein [Gordonia amarae]QHN24149.1 ATP-binding protein [Gordonia amarae]QHN33067.1 ATP-binding protein [Gordonia amarae]QHN41789.1 ATP-binding protein [Gordonia amarae]
MAGTPNSDIPNSDIPISDIPIGDTPISDDAAETRIERLFGIVVGSSYLVYLIILSPSIVSNTDLVGRWWTVPAVAVVFGPPLMLLGAAIGRHRRVARLAATATAYGYLVAGITWLLAWNHESSPVTLWYSMVPAFAALAAAIVMPARATIGYLCAAVVLACTTEYLARPDDKAGVLPLSVAFTLSFTLLFVAAGVMTLRTARLLDETRTGTYAAAAQTAATLARQAHRSKIDALLHDWVISTLLAAGRQGNVESVRQQALITLDKLDAQPLPATMVPVRAALTQLRAGALAVDLSPRVETLTRPEAAGLAIPAEVVDVLDAAVSEAVRNSVLHAGPDVTRQVTLRADARSLTVDVLDDGCGFDPAAVPPHRLGVAVSVLRRVRALDGGAAQVVSVPGAGTAVHLSWVVPG